MRTAAHRRNRLDRIWDDESRFDAVVSSGRYLKLCDASQAALEQRETAWTRLKLDVLLGEGLRSKPAGSSSQAGASRAVG
jgi:hypothetical protein